MAHEIDITDGIASFASAREHAWHRLGTVLPDAMTAEQALTAANLSGWNVRKKALYITSDPILSDDGVSGGEQIEVPDKFATVRTNPVTGKENALGVVGPGYTVIQNEAHADILNAIVDESGAHFETAGALHGGKQVFLSMKLPRTIEIGGRDATDLYLIAQNSHDGQSAFRLMVTPVRVVCANTLAAALGHHKSSFTVRHTQNATHAIQAAREALGMTWAYVDEFEQELEKLIHADLAVADAEKIVRKVFKYDGEKAAATERATKSQKAKIDSVITLWKSSDTLDGFHESRYGMYQAVAEWSDHYAAVKGAGDQVDAASMKRAERAVSGEANRIKSDAFRLLAV